jgi:hypothetical protein
MAEANARWRKVRFKFGWPKDAEPQWHLDLVVAYSVVAPAVKLHKIETWRVHRRAVPDDAGHEFAFAFYADESTGQKIIEGINANPVLTQLRNVGLVASVAFDEGSREPTWGTERHWDGPIKAAWPSYMRGVSQMWLSLVESQITGEIETVDRPLLDRFVDANRRVSAMWYKQGSHAMLHHLNAMFGYADVYVQGPMRFVAPEIE